MEYKYVFHKNGSDTKPFNKNVAKLGKMITGRVGVKIDRDAPEYFGLNSILTDEEAGDEQNGSCGRQDESHSSLCSQAGNQNQKEGARGEKIRQIISEIQDGRRRWNGSCPHRPSGGRPQDHDSQRARTWYSDYVRALLRHNSHSSGSTGFECSAQMTS